MVDKSGTPEKAMARTSESYTGVGLTEQYI